MFSFRTAMENVYTLLQAPHQAAKSPSEGADGKINEQQGKGAPVLSPPPVPGIPHPGVGGGKHPFYSPREVQLMSFPHSFYSCFHHPQSVLSLFLAF